MISIVENDRLDTILMPNADEQTKIHSLYGFPGKKGWEKYVFNCVNRRVRHKPGRQKCRTPFRECIRTSAQQI